MAKHDYTEKLLATQKCCPEKKMSIRTVPLTANATGSLSETHMLTIS